MGVWYITHRTLYKRQPQPNIQHTIHNVQHSSSAQYRYTTLYNRYTMQTNLITEVTFWVKKNEYTARFINKTMIDIEEQIRLYYGKYTISDVVQYIEPVVHNPPTH